MPSFIRRLMRCDDNFFEMFIALADNCHHGSQVLVEMFQKGDDLEKYVERGKDIVHAGHNLTHTPLTRLNHTFVTSFDREDIQSLSSCIDGVLDLVDDAASRLVTHKIAVARRSVGDLARILYDPTRQLPVVVGASRRVTAVHWGVSRRIM